MVLERGLVELESFFDLQLSGIVNFDVRDVVIFDIEGGEGSLVKQKPVS